MNIVEARQFRELLLRATALELEVVSLGKRLDAIETAPAVERYVAPVVKRGPGRPRKNGS